MKSKNKQPLSSYERAQVRIKEIKGFYGHLTVYVIVNIVLLFARNNFRFTVINGSSLFEDISFLSWIDWDIYGTPIIWGIALAIHAVCVFGKNPFLGKSWEERQIQKYLEEDRSKPEKYKS